jgi:hypothetical protein
VLAAHGTVTTQDLVLSACARAAQYMCAAVLHQAEMTVHGCCPVSADSTSPSHSAWVNSGALV